MRVLLAEDDRDLSSVIERHLRSVGIDARRCFDADEARRLLAAGSWDAVVLDIMMPGGSGLDVLRDMRAGGDGTPVLLLTALDSIDDRVSGLDAGADDYLTKPFALEELSARVRALTRRTTVNKGNVYRIEDLELDIKQRAVRRGGREISLSVREFAMLEYLMRNAGIVLTREQIECAVWNYGYDGSSNIVDVYIRNLRRKIDDPFELKLIQTVRSVGYTIRGPEP